MLGIKSPYYKELNVLCKLTRHAKGISGFIVIEQ